MPDYPSCCTISKPPYHGKLCISAFELTTPSALMTFAAYVERKTSTLILKVAELQVPC